MGPLSWKYLTRGMVFCLKLVRRLSVALGLSSGRPCCSARFSRRSFNRWLAQARNTTRSGVQICQGTIKRRYMNIRAVCNWFQSEKRLPWLARKDLWAVSDLNCLDANQNTYSYRAFHSQTSEGMTVVFLADQIQISAIPCSTFNELSSSRERAAP